MHRNVEPDYSIAPQADLEAVPRPGFLLKKTYWLYRGQFRRWFTITAPTSFMAAAVLWMANQGVKAILRGIPQSEIRYRLGKVLATVALRAGGYFISWLIGCFALAAVATVVSDLDGNETEAVWKRDSHQRAREHFGALALAALFTSCAFLAGCALAGFVELAAARVVGWRHVFRFNYGAALVGCVVISSMVSWLGAAIPLIVRGNTTVWAALKKSVELSSGYEGALFLLVVQTFAGSYLAWYATYYGVRFLIPDSLRYTEWYGWVVYGVALLAAAAVEPPIFIGFSLLADPEQLNASSLPNS
ncbi:MAG: hypothetical protein ABSE44_20120 [Candidatus Sulfotelmatobacter sp.]|jgi:hypothetical protein